MKPSDADGVPNVQAARASAIHALAIRGMTPSLLSGASILLALVDEARPAPPRDKQRAEILSSAFEKLAASARASVPAPDADSSNPAQREATWVAAAGELLGLTDEAAFARRLGRRQAVFDGEVHGRTPWYIRKLRASVWARVGVRTVERNAKLYWWPAFLVAVEQQLRIEQPPVQSATEAGGAVSPSQLARLVPLSGVMREALDAARAACAARRRAFYTPDLLLALLDLPGSRTVECLEQVQTGLASRVREWLAQSLRGMNAETAHPFRPFEWTERPEVALAQDLALADGAPVVTEIYLLLGVLRSRSGTRSRLEAELGPGFDRLCAVAEARRRSPAQVLETPGLERSGD